MTETYVNPTPRFAFRRTPFHLSIGRGGKLLWISRVTSYLGDTIHEEYVVAWGGKWRFRIVPERAAQ